MTMEEVQTLLGQVQGGCDSINGQILILVLRIYFTWILNTELLHYNAAIHLKIWLPEDNLTTALRLGLCASAAAGRQDHAVCGCQWPLKFTGKIEILLTTFYGDWLLHAGVVSSTFGYRSL